jgi:hypothetical protein
MERLSRHSDAPILDQDGKPSEVEPNVFDIANIFTHYQRYRRLRPDIIAALNGKNVVATRRRMKQLTRQPNNYLFVPDEFYSQPFPNSRYQIYELDLKGESLAKDEGLYNELQFGDKKLFDHSMGIIETISSIQIGAERAGDSMVWWDDIRSSPKYPPENDDRKAPTTLPVTIAHRFKTGVETFSYNYTNDSHGPFGVELANGFRFFSLEFENRAKLDYPSFAEPSFLKKFLSMQYIEEQKLYGVHWGLPNLIHQVVCINQHEVDRRKNLILQLTDGKGASYVAFAVVPSIKDINKDNRPRPRPELYTGPWQRAGQPDLFINAPLGRR